MLLAIALLDTPWHKTTAVEAGAVAVTVTVAVVVAVAGSLAA